MDDFEDLQRLLRLKRYEAPPPDFFEDMLFEIHRQQRAQLLKRPLWRLVLDPLAGALPVIPATRYAYAGSCAAGVLAAGVMSARILNTPAGAPALAGNGAVQAGPPQIEVINPPSNAGYAESGKRQSGGSLAMDPLYDQRASAFALPESGFDDDRAAAVMSAVSNSRPRYVLDAQPVSYERTLNF